jgi:hypothetical protein
MKLCPVRGSVGDAYCGALPARSRTAFCLGSPSRVYWDELLSARFRAGTGHHVLLLVPVLFLPFGG